MYTLKTAAEATGKSKSAILRAIQKGRISATRNDVGEWQIDPAELHRVYPTLVRTDARITATQRHAPESATGITEIDLLRKELELTRAQLEREREFNRELSRRLDAESEERRRLTCLLTHQPEEPEKAAPTREILGLLEKLFRRHR